jgi:hypothetical protein
VTQGKKAKRANSDNKHDPRTPDPAKPPSFKDLLLAIPRDGGTFERMDVELREVDFDEP